MSRIADPTVKGALLRAAEEVFSERGVAGAKVEDIARSAGVSKGAFYLHFESKEAVVRRIVEAWLSRCASYFAAPTDYPDALVDPGALLDFCIEREVQLYEFLWETRRVLRIVQGCHGDYGYMIVNFRADIERRHREWLEQWKQDGLLRVDTDLDLATTLMSGAYEQLALRMVGSPSRPPFERWLEFAQDTFVRAFGVPELVAALGGRVRRAPSREFDAHRTVSNASAASENEAVSIDAEG